MELLWCVFNLSDALLENSLRDWKISKGSNIHSVGGDSGGLEAGAVGLASRAGEKVTTSTGDGTVAVVSVAAVTHLNGASHSHGGEGQDSEDLHLDGWVVLSLGEKEK